ncbi:MAG: hypothetical protein ACTSYB_01260 [Candidatus Helarchaeota archaeon]
MANDDFDPIARYVTFFKEFMTEDGHIKYREKIEQMPMRGERSLEINFDDLFNFDPTLAERTLQSPLECIEAAAEAIRNVMVIEAEDYARHTFHARFVNLPENHRIHLRKIRAEHIGKLISVNGILTRASEVKPQLIVGVFRCRRRGCEDIDIEIPQGDAFTKPYQCPNCNQKGPFEFLPQKSIFIDWQKIRIQEKPEELPAGQLPRSLDAYLKEDLVDTVRPGNRITAVGILYSARDMGQRGSLKTFHVFLEVNSLDTSEIDTERLEITPEEEKRIKELAKDEWVHRKIIHSIAPTMYGNENIKEAIALQLFGGVSRQQKDGTKFRGESHVLLVGDPGTGKSMLLQYVSKIAPRGLYTSGKGTTAVGLTAAVLRDKETGDFTLEAGALVLADRGIACLCGESRVLTDNGLEKIENLFNNQKRYIAHSRGEQIELCELDTEVVSLNSNFQNIPSNSSRIRRKYYNGDIIEIEFKSGFKIRLTPEHKIVDGNSLEWKAAKNFKIGEYVVAPLKIPERHDDIYILDIIPDDWLVILNAEEKQDLRKEVLKHFKTFAEFNRKFKVSRDFLSGRSQIKLGQFKEILKSFGIYQKWREKCLKFGRKASGERLKVNKITPDMAYFLGFIYGDGMVKTSDRRSFIHIYQSLKNKAQIDQLKNTFEQFSSKKLNEYERETVSVIKNMKVTSKSVILYVGSNLLAYIYNYLIEKNLKNLLKLPNKSLSAFIAGCFDSDGCLSIKKGRKADKTYETVEINFHLSNDESNDRTFMLALRRFNCYAKLIKLGNINAIRITGREDIRLLLEAIKDFSVKLKIIPKRKHFVSSFSDKLPANLVSELCNQIVASTNKSILLEKGIWSTLYAYKNKKYQPSRLQLLKIREKLLPLIDKKILQKMDLIINRDFFLDQIVRINYRKYDGFVYDLYVPMNHNYLSNGIFVHNCLDEFDKMEPSDRVAIHEAMEQNTISIAKAGIVATLNARTSILAAANPTFGRYDEYKTVAENIKRLPVTILSRFDLIFILRDRPEAERDSQMADVIIQSITEEVEPPIEAELLRKYIHYARRTCFPVLSPEAAARLKSFYVEKRSAGERQDAPVPITARQLGALIRLTQAHARMALRNEATIEDAEAAIRLLEYSLRQVGTDRETGMSDIDIIYTGQSKTQRDRLEALHDLIRDLVSQRGEAVPIEDILEEGERINLQRSFMERAIEQLIARGLIYQPEAGKIRPVD